MDQEEFNAILREIFNDLIMGGVKKYRVCTMTFGSQSAPQLDKFLEGKDLGLRPLARLLHNYGFKLSITPIPSDRPDLAAPIIELTTDFFMALRSMMAEQIEKDEEEHNIKKMSDAGLDLYNKIISGEFENK